jgi:hypothetical protein
VAHDLLAVHDVGGTQPGGGKSALYSYYNCRNRMLFARRNLGRRGRLRWAALAPVYMLRVVRRNSRAHLTRNPAVAARAVTGTLAGVAIAAFGTRPAR